MSTELVAIMLGVSVLLGLFGLIGVIWGLKNGQFDDEKKWTQGILIDGTDELNEAYKNDLDKKINERKNDGKNL